MVKGIGRERVREIYGTGREQQQGLKKASPMLFIHAYTQCSVCIEMAIKDTFLIVADKSDELILCHGHCECLTQKDAGEWWKYTSFS